MVTTYGGFNLICCYFDHSTRARNVEKCVIKYLELNKFHMPAKFVKLKLIKHFAHVTSVIFPIYGSGQTPSIDSNNRTYLVSQRFMPQHSV